MRHWEPERVASAAGARLAGGAARAGAEPGPRGVAIDSRALASAAAASPWASFTDASVASAYARMGGVVASTSTAERASDSA